MSTPPSSLAWRRVSAQARLPRRGRGRRRGARPSAPASGASAVVAGDAVRPEGVERPVLEEDVDGLPERRGAGRQDGRGLEPVVGPGEEDQVQRIVHRSSPAGGISSIGKPEIARAGHAFELLGAEAPIGRAAPAGLDVDEAPPRADDLAGLDREDPFRSAGRRVDAARLSRMARTSSPDPGLRQCATHPGRKSRSRPRRPARSAEGPSRPRRTCRAALARPSSRVTTVRVMTAARGR